MKVTRVSNIPLHYGIKVYMKAFFFSTSVSLEMRLIPYCEMCPRPSDFFPAGFRFVITIFIVFLPTHILSVCTATLAYCLASKSKVSLQLFKVLFPSNFFVSHAVMILPCTRKRRERTIERVVFSFFLCRVALKTKSSQDGGGGGVNQCHHRRRRRHAIYRRRRRGGKSLGHATIQTRFVELKHHR